MDKQETKIILGKKSVLKYIKFKILKRFAKSNSNWNNWKRGFSKKVYDLDTYQEKAIKLWNLCLNDKDARIYSSISTFKRMIENDTLLIILSPSGRDNNMTIIDLADGHHNCFNITFNDTLKDIAEDLKDSFDTEMERRVRSVEFSKKELMNRDLDSLVSMQFKNIQDQQLELNGRTTAHI